MTRSRRHAPGVSPGTYDTAHVRAAPPPNLVVTDYDETRVDTVETGELPAPAAPDVRRWIHVVGQPSLSLLEQLRRAFDLDPLALEDVISVEHRPKLTVYGPWRFLTLALPSHDGVREFEELSVFGSDTTVISFFAGDEAVLTPIRRRLEQSGSKMREHAAMYLVYSMLDLAVDLLFPLLDTVGERLDEFADQVLEEPTKGLLADIHELRSRLLLTRRMAWATREVVADFTRHLDETVEPERRLRPYLADCHDHVASAIDLIESYREMATSLVEIHLSAISNRLNDVMRVLTVIATLFIPPTFIVGIYGMNFDRRTGPWSMPELSWPYGYLAVMGLIAAMMVAMFIYFRRKRWI